MSGNRKRKHQKPRLRLLLETDIFDLYQDQEPSICRLCTFHFNVKCQTVFTIFISYEIRNTELFWEIFVPEICFARIICFVCKIIVKYHIIIKTPKTGKFFNAQGSQSVCSIISTQIKRLGRHADNQEVSRCRTRGESEESVAHGWQSMQQRDPPWFLNPGQTLPEVQNRGINDPTKGMMDSKH